LRLSHQRGGSVSVCRGRKRSLNDLTTAQHGELAKKKTQNLVDHTIRLLSFHETNRIVANSPRLSSQIRPSFAANALKRFQHSLHGIGLVRLSAL
jgi:hypothetical protein